MARYLISFDDGAMDFIPEEEMPAVADAAHAVVDEAKDAGVWVFGGGVYPHDEVSVRVVAPDGTVTDGAESKAYIAGVTIGPRRPPRRVNCLLVSARECARWSQPVAPRPGRDRQAHAPKIRTEQQVGGSRPVRCHKDIASARVVDRRVSQPDN
jgi:hypothetical protein